jgi:uncharacterized protein (DUF2147 family)
MPNGARSWGNYLNWKPATLNSLDQLKSQRKNLMRPVIFLLFLTCFAVCTSAAEQTIEGTWLSADGDGLIEIRQTDAGPIGVIAGSALDPEHKNPDRKDDLNPDLALRERPLLGLTIMTGFKAVGDSRWKGGSVYDPNSGKTYKCKLKLIDANTLEVRGYIGVSWLGRTETWTRHNLR